MKSIAHTSSNRMINKVVCALLAIVLLSLQFASLPGGFAANAEETAAAASISYDPNDGMITYGHTGPVGAYHFTASEEERDYLLSIGWEYQGIGFYSSWK